MSNGEIAEDRIVAVVTVRPDTVQGGGVPVFVAEDEQRLERMAILLAKMTRSMVHDLEGGTYVVVRH